MSGRLHWDGLTELVRSHQLATLTDLAEPGFQFVLVGGAIRDALIGRDPEDFDVIVVGDLEAAIDALSAHLRRRPASIGDAFQHTHRFIWKGVSVDIAMALGDLEADLGRRDLTMNALGLPLDGAAASATTVVDPHGGLRDLERGLIRAVAESNLAADPLRGLRAVRYVGQLDFEITPETVHMIARRAADLASVAPERVAREWQALLGSSSWRRALDLAWKTGPAAVTFGPRTTSAATAAWAAAETNPDLAGRLAALLCELGEPSDPAARERWLVDRRWPRRLARRAALAAGWAGEPGADARLAELALQDPGAAHLAGRLAAALDRPAARLTSLAARAEEDRWVTGDHLLAAGATPDAALGRILQEAALGQVLRRWPDAASARAWAERAVGECG